ncbi:hypothetical protein AB0F43_32400 [Kribbella sp. NPDC023972]|uniref:hypothetical protein n=1 Tax=Kribbella sp. NPDC023972 TaxID=3154795 RepID=UPI0033C88973
MDRGVLLDRRTTRAWQIFDNLAYGLSASTTRANRWNQQVYVEQNPPAEHTYDGIAHADGSMTLSGGTYYYLAYASDQMYLARLSTDPYPEPEVTRRVHNAVGAFVRTYLDLYNEPAPEDDAGRALDTGLRANTAASYMPHVIDQLRLENGFPGIKDLPTDDPHPALQGAAEALCERVGEATGVEPDDLRKQLQATPPAERWNVLTRPLVDQRLGARMQPDYRLADKVYSEDAARIQALLVKDLKKGFVACASAAEAGQDTRSKGRELVEEAVRTANQHLETFAGSAPAPVAGPAVEPAYAQVSAIVRSVHGELSGGQANVAWVLQTQPRAASWNGALEATNDGTLGQTRPDRSLAFDAQKVLAPLAEAHTAQRPLDPNLQADVRQAVFVVTREAARLHSPDGPGDPAEQAMKDGLAEVYAKLRTDQVMATLGYGESRPPGEAMPLSPAGRAASALTESVGQLSRSTQLQVVSQLLTTPPEERFGKAVALGLGKDAPRDTAGRHEVDAVLVPEVRAAFEHVARPASRFAFITRNHAERGRILGTQAGAQIADAKDHYAARGMSDTHMSQSVAMTGQVAAGSAPGVTTSHKPAAASTNPREAGNQISGR